MASFNIKKYLPQLMVIGAFLLISWLYAYPALSGRELSQGDNISWKGMSQEAKLEHEKTGKPVLWTNSMFGGMPTYTFYLGGTANYVFKIESALETIIPKPGYFFFISMLCFFLLMQTFGVNRWLAAIGGVAYAFSTYNPGIIVAGHDTKMLAMAYMPGVLAGMMMLYQGRWLAGLALGGITFALMFSMQHFQIVYYLGIIMVGMGITLLVIAIREGRLKQFAIATALTLLMLGLGAGPSLPPFLSSAEYVKTTMRGGESELTINRTKTKKAGGLDKEYAFRWSNGIGETFCLLVPYLYGGGSAEDASHAPATSEAVGPQADRIPTYWGPQPFLAGPIYFGAAICFLFILGMMVIRSPHKWWIAAVCLLAIVMSWGRHFPAFNYFLFDNLPGLNKFRTPSMVLVIPQFLFSVVAVWGLQDILKNYTSEEARNEIWKKTKLAAGVTAGLALLLGLGGSMFFDFTNTETDARYKDILEYLKEDRASMARNSGLLSAFYILASAGLIWAFLKKKINATYLIAGVGLIVMVDLIPISWRYLNESNYQDSDEYAQNFVPTPADQQVLDMGKGDPYYRVLDLSRDVYNDAIQSYFHKTVGGYSPAKMEIYQDLIDVHMNGQTFNAQVLNMLNTRFIIVPGGQQAPAQVLPNPNALGNAWFVSNIKTVATADEEMMSMKAPGLGDTAQVTPGSFNPRETAIVRNTFASQIQGLQPGRDSAASVKLDKYGLNEISFVYSNSREGLAVFSDIWYPYGWKAYVGEKEVPIIRANYVLRALRLPPGNNQKIRFVFHPSRFYVGNTIAGISSIILLALLAAAIFYGIKRMKSEDEQDEFINQPETPPVVKKKG